MIKFMAREEVRTTDVVVVQEPWRSGFDGSGYLPSGGPFRLIDASTKATRVSVYVNRKI